MNWDQGLGELRGSRHGVLLVVGVGYTGVLLLPGAVGGPSWAPVHGSGRVSGCPPTSVTRALCPNRPHFDGVDGVRVPHLLPVYTLLRQSGPGPVLLEGLRRHYWSAVPSFLGLSVGVSTRPVFRLYSECPGFRSTGDPLREGV